LFSRNVDQIAFLVDCVILESKITTYSISSNIKILRNVESGTHAFNHIFSGFEKLNAVRLVFGPTTDDVLKNLKVEVFPSRGYMGVSDEDGHIFASQSYIREGEEWSVYLDIVHELVHVRQFKEGKNLFDNAYSYVDRPTEIEAYRVAAEEARRIGISERDIYYYLEVPWVSNEEHIRLARSCNVNLDFLNWKKK
jgi:hypothetical protein